MVFIKFLLPADGGVASIPSMGPEERSGHRGQSTLTVVLPRKGRWGHWNRAMHCHADTSLQGAAMQLTTLINVNCSQAKTAGRLLSLRSITLSSKHHTYTCIRLIKATISVWFRILR